MSLETPPRQVAIVDRIVGAAEEIDVSAGAVRAPTGIQAHLDEMLVFAENTRYFAFLHHHDRSQVGEGAPRLVVEANAKIPGCSEAFRGLCAQC